MTYTIIKTYVKKVEVEADEAPDTVDEHDAFFEEMIEDKDVERDFKNATLEWADTRVEDEEGNEVFQVG